MLTLSEKSILKIHGKNDGFIFQHFREGRKLSLSAGNKKLPYNTLIFNIPAVLTCPFKTSFCAAKCYALKAERLYRNTRQARKNNYTMSRLDSFAEDIISAIHGINLKLPNLIKNFRIHESGDFYNQSYFNQWQSVAREFPEIQFYAYTKSFFLNFEDKAPNLILIASFDQTTSLKHLTYYEANKKYFDKTFSIVEKTVAASCIQDCTQCNLCFTNTGRKENITVNVH